MGNAEAGVHYKHTLTHKVVDLIESILIRLQLISQKHKVWKQLQSDRNLLRDILWVLLVDSIHLHTSLFHLQTLTKLASSQDIDKIFIVVNRVVIFKITLIILTNLVKDSSHNRRTDWSWSWPFTHLIFRSCRCFVLELYIENVPYVRPCKINSLVLRIHRVR